MDSLLESFKEFPDWCKRLFKHAPELGLWQLRDLDPLETWHRGRVILIGDASHGMLPTQGQGASQSIEDAVCGPFFSQDFKIHTEALSQEALGAFFKDVTRKPTIAEVSSILRVSTFSKYIDNISNTLVGN
jgi:salicylate hydroxylase